MKTKERLGSSQENLKKGFPGTRITCKNREKIFILLKKPYLFHVRSVFSPIFITSTCMLRPIPPSKSENLRVGQGIYVNRLPQRISPNSEKYHILNHSTLMPYRNGSQ